MISFTICEIYLKVSERRSYLNLEFLTTVKIWTACSKIVYCAEMIEFNKCFETGSWKVSLTF